MIIAPKFKNLYENSTQKIVKYETEEFMTIKKSIRLAPLRETIEITSQKRIYEAEENTPTELYDSYKISVLLSDGMGVVMKDQIYNTSCGDIVVFRPDELHFARIFRGGEHHYITFLIPSSLLLSLGGEDLAYIFEDKEKNRINHISAPHGEKQEILKICDKISYLISEENSSDLCIFAYIIELLYRCRGLYDKAKASPFQASTPAVITSTTRYITNNYKTIKNLDEIAKNANCSITYLTKTFKKHTGKTVWEFLTECRLAHAKIMLKGSMSVTEVCYECGFGDCSGFIKLFKKYEGITPLKYKKE